MRITLLYPHLPPRIDGIGDHTVLLAEQLAAQHAVTVLTRDAPDRSPVRSAAVRDGWRPTYPRYRPWGRAHDIARAVEASAADWLVVQYAPSAWGVRGFMPGLVAAVYAARRRRPAMRVALLAHEDYIHRTDLQTAVFASYQRPQFAALGRMASVVFFATPVWVDVYRDWFPKAKVSYLPIGSNIPDPHSTSGVAGNGSSGLRVAVFGGLGPQRDLGLIAAALESVASTRPGARAHYMGTDTRLFDQLFGHIMPTVLLDRPDGATISRALSESHIALSPFRNGVSTRRGSFLAALQHGVATVTTTGPMTDPALQRAGRAGAFLATHPTPRAFATAARTLAENDEVRRAVATGGRRYYLDHHDWPDVARAVTSGLQDAS